MSKIQNVRQVPVAHDEPPVYVTVRVGLFFDGTGNNRVNTGIGMACQARLLAGEQGYSCQCASRHANPLSSYGKDPSNIARLYEHYRQQRRAVHEQGRWIAYWPLYVSGVGTVSGERDSLWPGQSLGRGATGVLAKVERALDKLGEGLAGFAGDNPGCVIGALELDIFGFSRGAASARHLVNEVFKRERGALTALLARRDLPLAADFVGSHDRVRVMVVGLFDTVAAVGGFRDLGNVRDFSNHGVNLYLPPGCAQQVLHLVARDEQRRNFALNSVMPGWPREIVLPGVHSDIGGGYPQAMFEDVLLTRPRTSLIGTGVACEDSPAWREASAELQEMDPVHWLDPQDPQGSLQVQCSRVHGRGGSRLVMASVRLHRQVYGHLSRVHLRIMHALACEEGVPFMPLGEAPELALTAELHDIARRLAGLARDDNVGLTPLQEQLLRWRYIHSSAHWSPLIGKTGGLGDAMFIHAPQPGGRVVHANVMQPGYPH